MKPQYVASLGLPKGFKFNVYETLDEILNDTTRDHVVEMVNAHLWSRQLALSRKELVRRIIAKTGFQPVVSEDGKTMTESERDFVKRFEASNPEGFGDGEAFWNSLQALADTFKDTLSAKPVVKPLIASKIPATFFAAADQIMNNGTEEKWKGIFKRNDIPFDDFQTSDAKVNRLNLASACYRHNLAETAKKYA